MDQQGSHVGVALPADMPQFAALAAAVFSRGHSQPGAELPTIGKTLRITHGCFQSTGRQQANAADFVEFADNLILGMPARQLGLALVHRLLVQVDLTQQHLQCPTQGADFRAIQQLTRRPQKRGRRDRRLDAHFAKNPTQQIDPLSTGFLPGLTQVMQLL